MIRLVIPEASPSANSYVYSHWAVRYKDKQRWFWMVRTAGVKAKATQATCKRKLTIERHGKP